jgi:intracellular sulfur oxidation DsrE/DsrF family protein
MASNGSAADLLESSKQEITAVTTIVTGRRGILRTFTLTVATSVIGLASTVAKPAAAAAEAALTPPFSGEDNSIPALMRRGVVFMSCHNAIWEQAGAPINPDKLSHPALAAELTNHLVDGAVLIPGAAGTLPELQQVGFYYAK